MKESSARAEEEAREEREALERALRELKGEHYSLVRRNKEQSDQLTREIENGLKTHYIKNIVLSYLTTSDPSV